MATTGLLFDNSTPRRRIKASNPILFCCLSTSFQSFFFNALDSFLKSKGIYFNRPMIENEVGEDNMTYILTHGGREREHHKKLTNQKYVKLY